MRPPPSALNEQQTQSVRELSSLRNFAGPPKDFWPKYLAALAGVAAASKAVLLTQDPNQNNNWKRLGEWSVNMGGSKILATFQAGLESFATDCAKQGQGILSLLEEGTSRNADHFVIATILPMQRASGFTVVVLLLSEFSEAAARDRVVFAKAGHRPGNRDRAKARDCPGHDGFRQCRETFPSHRPRVL
jgi:hypothetical protein